MSEIVKQIKDKGFPYYPEDSKWRNKTFETMLSFDRTNLVDRKNKVIGQSAHISIGVFILPHLIPHACSI